MLSRNRFSLSPFGASPRPAMGRFIRFDGVNDSGHAADADAFSRGNGVTDLPFTLAVLAAGDDQTGAALWAGKEEEIEFTRDGNTLRGYKRDISTGAAIGRSCVASAATDGRPHLFGMTDAGGSTNASVRLWLDAVRADTADYGFGSGYVAMENRGQAFAFGKRGGTFLPGVFFYVAFFDVAFTEADWLELRNGGYPILPGHHSKAANIIGDWYQDGRGNFVSSTGGHALTVDGSPATVYRPDPVRRLAP